MRSHRAVSGCGVLAWSPSHTDYTRWSLVVAHQNIAAGEEIRYLARRLIDPAELTTDDFWLFDDKLVAFTVFEPSGQFVGVRLRKTRLSSGIAGPCGIRCGTRPSLTPSTSRGDIVAALDRLRSDHGPHA
nr:DUF6879 family protein [Nocardia amamiensis]